MEIATYKIDINETDKIEINETDKIGDNGINKYIESNLKKSFDEIKKCLENIEYHENQIDKINKKIQRKSLYLRELIRINKYLNK